METKKIYEQMSLVLLDIEAVAKSRTNTQGQGYKFRGIDDVYNTIHEVLAKHKVFAVPTVLSRSREERQSKSGGNLIYTIVEVKYTFYATDGSSVESVTVGEAMDSGDKSCNKAMSAAHKYCLLQTFCIPTEDEKDTETQTHHVLPKSRPMVSAPAKKDPNALATENQRKMIWAKIKTELRLDDDDARAFIVNATGKQASKDLVSGDVEKVLTMIATSKAAASANVGDAWEEDAEFPA